MIAIDLNAAVDALDIDGLGSGDGVDQLEADENPTLGRSLVEAGDGGVPPLGPMPIG